MNISKKQDRRKLKVRSKIGDDTWRLSLNRSNRCLSAQLIRPITGEVLIGAVDKKVVPAKEKLTKTDRAYGFGKWFGDQLKQKKIDKIALDRGSSRYHGRVKAFTEGLRSDGVKI